MRSIKIGVRVGDIMTRDFISVKPETSLLECAKIMVKKRVGSLILHEEEKLRGIITERDILWALSKKNHKELGRIKCSEISPRKIVTIKPGADLMTAIKLMQKTKFRRLPVVVKNNLVGLLTLKDILRVEPELFEIACGHSSWMIREEEEKLNRKKHLGDFDYDVCEECGSTGLVESIDDRFLCRECSEKM